jgi:TRAP-type C4-dicarboxylate transport system permease small subunit
MIKGKFQDKFKAWLEDYLKTGWKVLLLQALIFLSYLGVYALSNYLFGDIKTPKIESFIDYLIFPIAILIIFILYLLINGIIARRFFGWK